MNCKPHRVSGEFTCTNILPSGKHCHYSLCDECFEYSESKLHLLPHKTDFFCYDCILILSSVNSCRQHGIKSDTPCDNALKCGRKCPQLLCKHCLEYSEDNERFLPSRLASFCYDCIDVLQLVSCETTHGNNSPDTPTCKTNLFVDLTTETPEKDSPDSLLAVNPHAATHLPGIVTNSPRQPSSRRKLFNTLELSSSTVIDHDSKSVANWDLINLHQPLPKTVSIRSDLINEHQPLPDSLKQPSMSVTIPEPSGASPGSLKYPKEYAITGEDNDGDHLNAHIADASIVLTTNTRSDLINKDKPRPCLQVRHLLPTSGCPGSILNRDLISHRLRDPTEDLITGEDENGEDSNPYSAVASIVPMNIQPDTDLNHIYAPDWYITLAVSNEEPSVIHAEYKKRNWITDGLLDELATVYPTESECTINRLHKSCGRSLDAFNEKCTRMFPVGRVFMNYIQLDQATKYFLDGWNCKKVKVGKSVRCFYSPTMRKAYVSKSDPSKRRKTEDSIKTQYQCPFVIRYSFLGYKKNNIKPCSFYKVKITECNTTHTCELSNQFFNHAKDKSSGQSKIELSRLNTLLTVLKTDPSTSANALRPLIVDSLSFNGTPIDAAYIRNFRQRVAYYHAKNPNYVDVTLEDAQLILSKKKISDEEHLVLNDPFIRTNFNSMLQEVMAEDSTTWEALSFLRRCKNDMPGFDFRIRLAPSGRPNGILYMTPLMRSNLLRFGTLLFLDAQKRGHNAYNWPYIAPVIKDHNLQIGLISEAIILSEDLDTYAWILRSISEMEPRWKLSSIKAIFADQFVTQKLLINLGIQETCILRGDYYHLMKEVWPQPENFGTVTMAVIGKWLRVMLLSEKVEECDNAYQAATAYLSDDPLKINKLEKIYHNPSYYCGYVIRALVGNLKCRGSVPSEQNHSSVIAYLGKGNAGMSIMTHCSRLLKRAQEHAKSRTKEDNKSQVNCYKYVSKEEGQLGVDDVLAKKSLSPYCYKIHYTRSSQRAQFLQSDVNSVDGKVSVWPAGKEKTLLNCFILGHDIDCICQIKTDFYVQCEHEYFYDGRFMVNRYASRWLHNHVFLEKYPELSASRLTSANTMNEEYAEIQQTDLVVEDNIRDHDLENDIMDNDLEHDIECSHDIFISDNNDRKVGYHELLEVFKELAICVQNNKTQCAAVFSETKQWINCYRHGEDFEVKFITSGSTNPTIMREGTIPQVGSRPLRATTMAVAVASRQSRKRSSLEIQRSHHASKTNSTTTSSVVGLSQMSQFSNSVNTDAEFLLPTATRKRRCRLCAGKGHGQFKCPVIIAYGASPFPMNNAEYRIQFQADLCQMNTFGISIRCADDDRVIMKSFPKSRVPGLIIHRRLLTDNSLVKPNVVSNMCVECTLLLQGGGEDERYTLVLFQVGHVGSYVNRNKMNLIVSLLKRV